MSRQPGTDLVEPDLPITPMLDMSFQLLAFFIMTFKPAPTEGQIALALPPVQDAGFPTRVPDPGEQPTRFVVRVQATDSGTIAGINLREAGTTDDRGTEFGADVAGFAKELRARSDRDAIRREEALRKGLPVSPAPRLTLEIGEKLLHGYVVQLFDSTMRAGFADIGSVPLDPKKR